MFTLIFALLAALALSPRHVYGHICTLPLRVSLYATSNTFLQLYGIPRCGGLTSRNRLILTTTDRFPP